MKVKIAGVEFDNVLYDRDADVLYLQAGLRPARPPISTPPPKATIFGLTSTVV
jgi:hypothetical protein